MKEILSKDFFFNLWNVDMVLQDINFMSPKMICGFDPEKEKCWFIDSEKARLHLSYKRASLRSVLCCISTNELWQKVKNRDCTHKIDLKAPNSHSSAQCCNTIGYLRMRKTSTVCKSIWLSDRKENTQKGLLHFPLFCFLWWFSVAPCMYFSLLSALGLGEKLFSRKLSKSPPVREGGDCEQIFSSTFRRCNCRIT